MALILEYGFNEGAGTVVADSSGGGHPGTAAGAPWLAPGHGGSAAAYSGTGAAGKSVDIPDFGAGPLQEGTIMFWAKPPAAPAATGTAFYFAGGPNEVGLDLADFSGYRWLLQIWRSSGPGGYPLADLGSWQHLAFVLKKTAPSGWTVSTYKNGVLAFTEPETDLSTYGMLPTTGNLAVGQNNLGGASFAGEIDDFRVFNTPLTGADINTWMGLNAGQVPADPAATVRKSSADLEYAYLGSLGATGSLADRREKIYGDEWAYFSARSGLAPASFYSLNDHKTAYYAQAATAWVEKRRNRATNPAFRLNITGWNTWTVGGGGGGTNSIPSAGGPADDAYRALTLTAVGDGAVGTSAQLANDPDPTTPGDPFYSSFYVKAPRAVSVIPNVQHYTRDTATQRGSTSGPPVVLVPDVWTRIGVADTVAPLADSSRGGIQISANALLQVGDVIGIARYLPESVGAMGTYFDGSTAAAGPLERYRWLGAPNASQSVYETRLSSVASSGGLNEMQRRFWSLALGL